MQPGPIQWDDAGEPSIHPEALEGETPDKRGGALNSDETCCSYQDDCPMGILAVGGAPEDRRDRVSFASSHARDQGGAGRYHC